MPKWAECSCQKHQSGWKHESREMYDLKMTPWLGVLD